MISQNDFCNFKHGRLNNGDVRDAAVYQLPIQEWKTFFPQVLGMLTVDVPHLLALEGEETASCKVMDFSGAAQIYHPINRVS